MCVDGEVTVKTDTISEKIYKGETILIPAAVKEYIIETDYAKLLEVYI